MKKEEILSKAQNNNKRGNEYENIAALKSSTVDLLVILIVGASFFIVEALVKKVFNWGMLALLCYGFGSDQLYLGIGTKKTLKIILGSLSIIIGVFFTVIYVVNMVK